LVFNGNYALSAGSLGNTLAISNLVVVISLPPKFLLPSLLSPSPPSFSFLFYWLSPQYLIIVKKKFQNGKLALNAVQLLFSPNFLLNPNVTLSIPAGGKLVIQGLTVSASLFGSNFIWLPLGQVSLSFHTPPPFVSPFCVLNLNEQNR
jgi:hypothetical protein